MAVVLNQDLARKYYTRDVNIGVVSVSLNDVADRATMKQLIVAASGKDPLDEARSNFEYTERLVVIRGLAGIAAQFKLERASLLTGIAADYDIQENGTVCIRFRSLRPMALIYRGGPQDQHRYLIVLLTMTNSRTEVNAAITQAYGQDVDHDHVFELAIYNLGTGLWGQPATDIVREYPEENYSLLANVREAEHASIVEIRIRPQQHIEPPQILDR
jgi:hypothetical protein